MSNQIKIIQNPSYYSNHYNNNQSINIYPVSNNINIINSFSHQNFINKPQNLKNTFTVDSRKTKTNQTKNNNYNNTYNNNKINANNKNINSYNDTKSNYSIQSYSSSNTIKSMINTINKNIKSSGDISFQDIKYKKYPSTSLNSSKINSEDNYSSKYMSTNYYSYNTNKNEINSFAPNSQNKFMDYNQINIIIKQNIENAKINEEIILPPNEISLDSLNITKPIRIKGQQNSCLIINRGPISIDLKSFNEAGKRTNNNINFIKFSQLKIIFNDHTINREKKITTLFKLRPSSFLELEDCDIVFQNKNKQKISSGPPHTQNDNNEKKSVAFVLSSNKKNENQYNLSNPTNLTLTNTRMHNFYQSIRAGQNCIVNINKSAFVQNYGKAIVMLNPLSLKVNGTFFQYNGDNTIHVKYTEECLYEEKRKIIINENDFDITNGNDICIEGLKNNKLDLSIIITKNYFHNNTSDGVLVYNVIYNNFDVINNIFKENQGNGLNIQKSFFKGISSTNKYNISYQLIKIKDNQFIENKGFGLFINDCLIEATSNKFTINKQSGMSLCNIMIDDPQKGYEGINLIANSNEDEYSSIAKSIKKSSSLLKNIFYENRENGLFIYEYPYHINILESVFTNNCKHGISIDLNNFYNNSYGNKSHNNFHTILNEFKSNSSKKANDLSNISLNKCIIEKNLKAGILIDTCFIFCEETFIMNNVEYAISIRKKEFQYCFKDGKNNTIYGSMGGNWGRVDSSGEAICFSCMGGQKLDMKKKEEILKKVPSFINQSEESMENYIGKKINFSHNNNNNNTNLSNRMNKSYAENEKKNSINKKPNKEEDDGCFIF